MLRSLGEGRDRDRLFSPTKNCIWELWGPSPLSTCHCLTYSSAPLVLNQVISSGQDFKQPVLLQWKRVVFTAPGEETVSLIWIKVEDRSAGWSACFQMRSPGVDLCPLGWPSWTWWHTSCWDWWGVWMVYSTAASILNRHLGE